MIEELKNYLNLIEFRLKEPAFDIKKKGLNIGDRHHIIPKSINKRQIVLDLFTKYGYTDIDQLVCLTYREHFIVHRLLQIIARKLLDKDCYIKMDYAWRRLSSDHKHNDVLTEEDYEDSRKMWLESIKLQKMVSWSKGLTKETDDRVKQISIRMTGINNPMYNKKGNLHHNFGKLKSELSKIKQSITEKEQYKNGERTTWSKGLTKETDERVARISENHKGKKNGMYNVKGKDNLLSKPIVQINLNGDFIKRYDSIRDASDFLKINYSGIIQCLKKKYRTSGNYIWFYENEWDENYRDNEDNLIKLITKITINSNNQRKKQSETVRKNKSLAGKNNPASKPIEQLDLNGNFIKRYDYIRQAEQELHISNISACCRGKIKSAGGFKWKYE